VLSGILKTGSGRVCQPNCGGHMKSSIGKLGACAVACLFCASVAAQAKCRDVTVRASGSPLASIDDAKFSASEALAQVIAQRYGANWTAGSHRNGAFTCTQVASGPNWTCTAKTIAICAP
jgi:hypothetical protein